MTQNINKLNTALNYVKDTFVGKNDVVDLLGICLLARENAFCTVPRYGKICYCKNIVKNRSGR